jgi:outer membrane protein assembly factor BamA
VLAALLTLALFAQSAGERIVDVRVQGNTLTEDAEIMRMAEVQPGSELTSGTLDAIAARLKNAGRFERVEVVKRYASIADPSQILLVIIVDEGRITVRPAKDGQPARAVRRRGPPLMFLPLLGNTEGYGFTYGALLSMPNLAGPGTRVSVPVTWGGERRIGAVLEKRFDSPRLTRVRVDGALLRRENPAFDAIDERRQAWVRGEREIARALRLGAWGGIEDVSFSGTDSFVTRSGVDATFDTRVDPMLSRNAVYTRAGVERLAVRDRSTPIRTMLDASGYVGGFGASTIMVRVFHDGANMPLPAYLKVLLGRESTLRGYPSGEAAGDATAAGTVELRVPVNSPLNIIKVGVRAFVDAATVYDAGEHLRDQRFVRSVGGGVWFTATVIRLAVDVAHASSGSTRVEVSSGLLF